MYFKVWIRHSFRCLTKKTMVANWNRKYFVSECVFDVDVYAWWWMQMRSWLRFQKKHRKSIWKKKKRRSSNVRKWSLFEFRFWARYFAHINKQKKNTFWNFKRAIENQLDKKKGRLLDSTRAIILLCVFWTDWYLTAKN